MSVVPDRSDRRSRVTGSAGTCHGLSKIHHKDSKVKEGRGIACATRFPSLLIKPDMRISDWFHRAHSPGGNTSVFHVPIHLGCTTEFARTAPGFKRCLRAFRQFSTLAYFDKRTRSQGPSLPRRYPASTVLSTLSDSRMDRCLAAPLRPPPSSCADLPRLRDPLSRRAAPLTLVDRSGCICRLLPHTVLPSPICGRVGVHNFPFKACSGFTHVMAHRFAPLPPLPFHALARAEPWAASPEATFVAGLRYGQLPNRTACQLPGQPTTARVGLPPTR